MGTGAVAGILVEGGLVVSLTFSTPAKFKPVSSFSDISPNVMKRAAIKTSMRKSNTSAHLHIFECRPTTTGAVFDDSFDSDSIVAIGLSDAPKESQSSPPPPAGVFIPPSRLSSPSQVTTRFSPTSPPKVSAASSSLVL